MGAKDDILREIAGTPEPVLQDVLEFLRARKRRGETALASESSLAKDWNRPEEDAAWADL